MEFLSEQSFLLHRVPTRRPTFESSAAEALSTGVNSGMPFRKERMTRKRVVELVDSGNEMIFGNSLRESPYTSDMMNFAYTSRNERTKSQ